MKDITLLLLFFAIVLAGCSSDNNTKTDTETQAVGSVVSGEKITESIKKTTEEEQVVASLHTALQAVNSAAQQCFEQKNKGQCKDTLTAMNKTLKILISVSNDSKYEAALESYPKKTELVAEANTMNKNIKLIGNVIIESIMANAPK